MLGWWNMSQKSCWLLITTAVMYMSSLIAAGSGQASSRKLTPWGWSWPLHLSPSPERKAKGPDFDSLSQLDLWVAPCIHFSKCTDAFFTDILEKNLEIMFFSLSRQRFFQDTTGHPSSKHVFLPRPITSCASSRDLPASGFGGSLFEPGGCTNVELAERKEIFS